MAIAAPDRTRYLLDEDRIPRAWYNIAADLPARRRRVLQPGDRPAHRSGRPRAALPDGADQAGRQPDREIEIPEPVREVYSSTGRARSIARIGWRGRSIRPAHIYYKYEGGSPSGSHKPNTALAQAYYNKAEGVTRLATETGAGPVGERARVRRRRRSASRSRSTWSARSYDQKPYRRNLMETYGAQVVPSPSPDTSTAGRSSRDAVPHRLARAGDQRGDRGHRHPSRARSTRWARCSTSSCSTRP